jgi:predicted alpha/beta superfamily hydrolase
MKTCLVPTLLTAVFLSIAGAISSSNHWNLLGENLRFTRKTSIQSSKTQEESLWIGSIRRMGVIISVIHF